VGGRRGTLLAASPRRLNELFAVYRQASAPTTRRSKFIGLGEPIPCECVGLTRCSQAERAIDTDLVVRAQRGDKEAYALLATEGLPPEIAEEIPLDLFGLITGLPAETEQIPWDGPKVRIIEHQAHAQGHAALLIGERGVLVAGDMLSDILIPFPDLGAANPIEDCLTGLRLLEGVADDVDVLIPGHGSVGGADQVRARIEQDRAYVHALCASAISIPAGIAAPTQASHRRVAAAVRLPSEVEHGEPEEVLPSIESTLVRLLVGLKLLDGTRCRLTCSA
jgi:glyoxylase-like metal-dependent hydrolase (beta-lactamase superfamily II)